MRKRHFASDPLGYVFNSQWPMHLAAFLNVLYFPFSESTPKRGG